MAKKKKFFIRIGDHIEQVTEEIYKEYFRMLRRERYLEERDLAHGRLLYSQFDNDYMDILGEEMLIDGFTEDICDYIIKKTMIETLMECLSLLSDDELNLIIEIFYKEKSHRQLSDESGIPMMTIGDRKNRILKKLKKFMEK